MVAAAAAATGEGKTDAENMGSRKCLRYIVAGLRIGARRTG